MRGAGRNREGGHLDGTETTDNSCQRFSTRLPLRSLACPVRDRFKPHYYSVPAMPDETQPTPTAAPAESSLDMVETLRAQQNFPKAVLAGAAASILGAAAWAIITVSTELKLGIVAIGIGFLVGYAIRTFGKGVDSKFAVLGAGLSLFGCALGNLLSAVGFIAAARNADFLSLLTSLNLEATVEIMKITFSPMDILFYGISIYRGYNFSRKVA